MFLAAESIVPATITALAGLVTAAGWAYAQFGNRKAIKKVHEQVGTATDDDGTNLVDAVKQVQTSVGTTNGTDLAALVSKVDQEAAYTHDAVHRIEGSVKALAEVAPKLLADVASMRDDIAAIKRAPASTQRR